MASGKKLQGITIEIDGNTTKLSDSLKNVNKTIATTSSELKNINGLLKLDPSNTVLLNQKQQVLAETIKATAEKLEQLKKAQKDADTSGVDKNTDSYRELQREIAASESKMKKLKSEYSDNEKEIKKNNSILEKFKQHLNDSGNGAIKLGDLIKANLISEGIKKGLETLANSMKKIGNSIIGLGKDAVNSYADYEQLVGGIETLFGEDNASKVIENAQKAYKNAGLSANEYMDTITSFSASLISSLGGDTKKATSYADSAIKDMSDNANKMGTDISSIQNAYQGFAKQNYTMLDNLKLGYGGTKTEMERLIADANKVKEANGEMANLSINSFADVTEAIHIIQNEMGITGTTAQEAGTTITGSVNAMKSAWANLVTGLADGNSNMEQLITDFVTTIVGDGSENNRGVIGNILPVIVELVKKIPLLISELIPQLVPVVIEIITELANALVDNIDLIVDTIITLFTALVDLLTNPDMIEKLISAAVYLIIEFSVALVKAIPEIVRRLPQIINAIFKGLVDGIAKTKWGSIGLDILKGLLNGMLDFGNIVKDTIAKVGNKITGAIKSFFGIKSPSRLMKKEVGKYLAEGIAVGFEDEIPNTIDDVQNAMKELNTGIQASVNPTINPQANTNPLIIQIENFNNQRESDIQALAEELEFYRKNSALAVGGN